MQRAIVHAELMAAFQNRFGIIPDYEHILQRTYERLITPDGTVVDIGAHTGRHTAVFANLVGPTGAVHAFEPLPFAFETLRNRGFGANVHLNPCALATRHGEENFVYARGSPEESGFRVKAYNQPELVHPETIKVSVRPLDDFVDEFAGLQFIKVDAEGAEVGCLESGRKTISRYRPFISVEYGQPSYSAYGLERRSLFDCADSLGYRVGDMFGAVCGDAQTWERVCDVAYWDWYLVPQERLDEWRSKLSTGDDGGTEEADALRAELAALRRSTSWRMTGPLRSLMRAVRRG